MEGHRRKQDEETSYWLSYSDMMAGLLLCFVLIISLTVLHANIQYDEKQNELLGKEAELLVRSDELENEKALAAEQQLQLNSQQKKLTDQEKELASQKTKLTEQEDTLKRQSDLLTELQEIMDSQQSQLDRIIGVRTELIESLKTEFEGDNLAVSVDPQTGAITMDSSVLFEFNQNELKDSGKAFLNAFLPRYVKILLSPKFRDYVSEIVIEGHTDNVGTYLFNLNLSQQRAYSVAAYCMNDENGVLSQDEKNMLMGVMSSSGRSYSNPIYKADGSIDMEASRRVEFQFRLKDEEMIREMIEILNSEQVQAINENGTTTQSTSSQTQTQQTQTQADSTTPGPGEELIQPIG